MTVVLSTAWAAEARADGATRQTPLLDALRMNNLHVMNGEVREWQIVGVFETMERAQAHNLELKRCVKARRVVAEKETTNRTMAETEGGK